MIQTHLSSLLIALSLVFISSACVISIAGDGGRAKATPSISQPQGPALDDWQDAMEALLVANKCVIDIRPGNYGAFPDDDPPPFSFMVMVTHILDDKGNADPTDDAVKFQVHSRKRGGFGTHDDKHAIDSTQNPIAGYVKVAPKGALVEYHFVDRSGSIYLREKLSQNGGMQYPEQDWGGAVTGYDLAKPLEVLSFYPDGNNKAHVRFRWRGVEIRFLVYFLD